MNGKGDKPRPTNRKAYEEGYDRAFGDTVEEKVVGYANAKDLKCRPHDPGHQPKATYEVIDESKG